MFASFGSARGKTGKPRRCQARQRSLQVEPLEDRRLLSVGDGFDEMLGLLATAPVLSVDNPEQWADESVELGETEVGEVLEAGAMLGGTVYVVDSLDDVVAADGKVTLREAIQAANTNTAGFDAPAGSASAGDVIRFDPSLAGGTITLDGALGQLEIRGDLSIEGDQQTINADHKCRVFYVCNDSTVNLSNLVVTRGFSESVGGGINNLGTLLVSACTISDSSAVSGGGIRNAKTLAVINSIVARNSTDGYGGGIDNHGEFSASGSTFLSNSAGNGGAIANYGGLLQIKDSVISDNSANGEGGWGCGGGIWNNADATLDRVTIASNFASDMGGGIRNWSGGSLTVTHSVISGNTAHSTGGGINTFSATLSVRDSEISENSAAAGGGICDGKGSVTIADSTISDNSSSSEGHGGGIFTWQSIMTVTGSTLSCNFASFGGGISNVLGTLTVSKSTFFGNCASSMGTSDYPRDAYGRILSHDDNAVIKSPGHNVYSSGEFYLNANTMSGSVGSINNSKEEVLTGFPAGQEPDGPVAILLGMESIAEDEILELDATLSFNATEYRWDLDHDGQFDDAFGSQVAFTYSQLVDFGMQPGPNTIALQVVDSEGATDEDTAVVTLIADEPAEAEMLAKYVAYAKNWSDGEYIGLGGYYVDEVFAGIDAWGLKSNVAGNDPILLFRGTDSIEDVFTDMNPEGIGFDYFQENRDVIESWLDAADDDGSRVDFIGHSLGGALAQWFAADWTGLGNAISDVITFNSPGISQTYADKFVASLAESATHYITNGDIVSMAGEAFVAGQYIVATFNDWNPLNKHMRPVTVEQTGDYTRPSDLVLSAAESTDKLNSEWFFYTDPSYVSYLAAAQTAVPSLNAGRLFFRGSAELLRQEMGKAIAPIVSILAKGSPPATGELTIDRVPIVPNVWELRDLKVAWDGQQYTATGGLRIPSGIVLKGTLEFYEGQVNGVGLGVDGINKPIGPSGFFFQSLDGGLYHFRQDDGEPTTIQATAGVTFGPKIDLTLPTWLVPQELQNISLVKVDGTLRTNAEELVLQGDIEVATGKLAKGAGTITIGADLHSAKMTANVDLLDGTLVGSADWTFENLGGVYIIDGKGQGEWNVPSQFTLLKGQTLANASYEVHAVASEFGVTGYVSITASVDLPGLGQKKIGMKVILNSTTEQLIGLNPEWSVIVNTPGETQTNSAAAASTYLTSATEQGTEVADQYSLLIVDWETANPEADVTLLLPSGEEVSEADVVGRDDIHLVPDLCNDYQRAYTVLYTPAQLGQWSARVDGVDGPITLSVYSDNQTPVVDVTSVTGGDNDAVTIECTASDTESIPSVALYLDTDNSGNDGTPIAIDLTPADFPYSWTPSNVPSGEYYVYAVVDDGVNVAVVDYAETPLTITTTPSLTITDNSGLVEDGFVMLPSTVVGEVASTTRSFVLTNEGLGQLTVDAIALGGDAGNFSVSLLDADGSALPFAPMTLLSGESVELEVAFAPTQSGPCQLDLVIQSNVPGQETISLAAWGAATDPPPTVETITINDGDAQRSMVNSLQVTFNKLVDVDAGAFEVVQRGTGLAVDVLFATEDVGGKTIATLTFKGDHTEYGSLVDGNYQLTILADRVHDRLSGLDLDGDGDGISGGDHLFGEEEVDAFFRFFGDFDGDRDVDNRDFLKFRNSFRTSELDPAYLWCFDFDNDGDVDNRDFLKFRSRFREELLFT